jgi:gamma-glutamyltranspeptidase/glutathione hydrolase
MVVSVSEPASQAGWDALRDGGNAVDAAVATAFALAVTFPEAGNIGGGGFMLVHPGHTRPGNGAAEPDVIDYRETAPAATTPGMFSGGKPPSSYLLVGVPGTVRGLALAHRKYGRLPWKRLVEPAVRLARDGFEVDADNAAALNEALAKAADYPEFRRVFAPPRAAGEAGRPWRAGDRLVQPELAQTLKRIGDEGEAGFYTGPVAAAIVATVREGGGILTEADLAGYEAKLRRPVHTTYRGHDVYGPPPPSSGGIALAEMLNVLERFELRRHGRWSPRTLHLMIETMRRAFFDRARFLGDTDFVTVPTELTTKQYAARVAATIHPDRATPSETLAAEAGVPIAGAPEGEHTTHFSVIDADGMAVSNTYTLEQGFGGMVVVNGCGFLLNNEMGDFNPRPGVTDRTGRIGTPPNVAAPGKRMLSSMTPTIVSRGGRVVLVTGSPGGRTIINTVLCVVLNVLEFEMPLRAAVDAPRMHHPWLPDVVRMEGRMLEEHPDAVQALPEMGHTIDPKPTRQGDAHSIAVTSDGRYAGAADKRRSGAAVGR